MRLCTVVLVIGLIAGAEDGRKAAKLMLKLGGSITEVEVVKLLLRGTVQLNCKLGLLKVELLTAAGNSLCSAVILRTAARNSCFCSAWVGMEWLVPTSAAEKSCGEVR